MTMNSHIPDGKLEEKWSKHKANLKLVNPANKRKFDIIVIGTGLAGASAAASLGELGYNVKSFCFQDSPRRAHSIAAQGGINAAKNYRNDGDSVYRLFYDTIKGGDFRAREANVYRLAELSVAIIDQAVAQGVPFAREYGGLLDNRSFGGTQVSRTFYAKGQTGQQLLLGAISSMYRQISLGTVKAFPFHEMLDLVVINGRARGIVARNLITGEIKSYTAHAVVLASGGYGNIFYLSTNAKGSNATAIWRAYKKGAFFANPCFTQIHPTCIPVSSHYQSKLTLMSEGLRNDGRVWVPKNKNDNRSPDQIPEEDRDYFLETRYPAFGNLVPRDVASRAIKLVCDEGKGVGGKNAVYLDLTDAIKRLGKDVIEERYGNLFEMYEKITGESPYKTPMRIYPAIHYCMGGLWVDYNLMTTIPGLFALGECNFSDHGANRLGASALMQGLADGYFIIPYTMSNYLADLGFEKVSVDQPEFKEAENKVKEQVRRFLSIKGNRTVDDFHKELGKVLWDGVGMSRSEQSLKTAIDKVKGLRAEFWKNLKVNGTDETLNQSLEKAGRVSDFLELAELLAVDALLRDESCGCHFRVEHQTDDHEAKRDDEKFSYAAAYEYQGEDKPAQLHKEELKFEEAHLAARSYK
ncbi:MAG: fumarate reductase/succinate dehydrogenase flavoprotein subunit [Candidatus Eremiobacteraeota bacterium]|nr:fumarate reductase/succinate dehydrogenase flavoprotein subunit [Candidatus Eremiobacteraeota bacterium]